MFASPNTSGVYHLWASAWKAFDLVSVPGFPKGLCPLRNENVMSYQCEHEHDPMAWCWCTPQNVIDEHDMNMAMFMEGFDSRIQADRDAYATAHYGRHDTKSVGIQAISVNAGLPQTVEHLYEGQHRLDIDDTGRSQFFFHNAGWHRNI
jgi:hypothetical protein